MRIYQVLFISYQHNYHQSLIDYLMVIHLLVVYMDHYYQLNSLICKALNNKKLQRNSYQREWSDLGKELVKNMLYSLLMPVDKDKILRRHNEFSVMKDIYTDAAKLGIFFEKYRSKSTCASWVEFNHVRLAIYSE